MPVRANKPSSFIPAPAGSHHAVCVDVIDNGMVQGPFGIQPKVTFRWETRKQNPANNKPYLVQQRYTNSTHAKSNLGAMLSGWFGRPLTSHETSGSFDLETLIGRNAIVSVIHNERDGQTYANVKTVSPTMEGMEAIQPSGTYIREVARDKPQGGYDERNPPPGEPSDYGFDPEALPDDSEIPF